MNTQPEEEYTEMASRIINGYVNKKVQSHVKRILKKLYPDEYKLLSPFKEKLTAAQQLFLEKVRDDGLKICRYNLDLASDTLEIFWIEQQGKMIGGKQIITVDEVLTKFKLL